MKNYITTIEADKLTLNNRIWTHDVLVNFVEHIKTTNIFNDRRLYIMYVIDDNASLSSNIDLNDVCGVISDIWFADQRIWFEWDILQGTPMSDIVNDTLTEEGELPDNICFDVLVSGNVIPDGRTNADAIKFKVEPCDLICIRLKIT